MYDHPMASSARRLSIARIRAASAYMRAMLYLNGTGDCPTSTSEEGQEMLESINGATIAADEAATPEEAEMAALRAELKSFGITGPMDDDAIRCQYAA